MIHSRAGDEKNALEQVGTRWYAFETTKAAAELGVDPGRGLSAGDVRERAAEYGPNALVAAPRRARILVFLDQFRSLLAYVLIGAALLAAVVGDVKDPIVISAVLFINAVIGFVQVNRAERSMDALKRMLIARSRVRRDGHVVEIDSRALVPGDVVLLEAGDRVPADGRLIITASLAVDESVLTGESVPVDKISEPLGDEELPVAEHVNLAFMNTTVARGSAELLVIRTGMLTEIGRIAGMLASAVRAATPLQRQLDSLGRRIAALAGVASLAVFALALRDGEEFSDAALTAVALAVASIPEGLPAVVAVTLAVGARRMARRNAIVKRLASVETLGATSVICSDKTGTLTLNQMTARALWRGVLFDIEGHGYEPTGRITAAEGGDVPELRPALLPAVLCNNSVLAADGAIVGDPTEAALVVLAAKGGVDADTERRRCPRIAEIPFDSAHKFMATFHRHPDDPGRILVCVKGAPEVLIDRCDRLADSIDDEQPIDDARRRELEGDIEALAARGLRVLAIASRTIDDTGTVEEALEHELFGLVHGLRLEALVGILDPARPEAAEAIARCRDAGIQVKMITGDHAATARSIAADLGIPGRVITGRELDELDVEALSDEIDGLGVFARVAPEHKVRIVEALQRRQNIVAMTGDGVNDAAALKTADIGVAMGVAGTEVAREAGEMVLADDNFATIVVAIEIGRTIYDNILKFVRFQLSTNIGAILTILGALLVGLPTPFTPIQMLWVNLIMDGPPAIALGLDPSAPGVLNRPPRRMSVPILTRSRLSRLALLGVVMATGTLLVFAGARRGNLGSEVAGTMAFTTFVAFQLFNALNARSEHASVFRRHTLTNGRLWGALGAVAVLQIAAVHLSAFGTILDTVPLNATEWAVCAAVAATILIADELRKAATRARERRASRTSRHGRVSPRPRRLPC